MNSAWALANSGATSANVTLVRGTLLITPSSPSRSPGVCAQKALGPLGRLEQATRVGQHQEPALSYGVDHLGGLVVGHARGIEQELLGVAQAGAQPPVEPGV